MIARSGGPPYVTRKWRPKLSLVVFAVLSTVFCLPLIGLYLLRIDETEFIRQTEAELIAEAAVLAPVLADEIAVSVPAQLPLGASIDHTAGEASGPILPHLDPSRDPVLDPRPEARLPDKPADATYLAIGAKLAPDLAQAQQVTLTGFRVLDPNGVVIAGREEIGQSLAHVDEVQDALHGRFRSVLRRRILNHVSPPLGSISRGADIRVFVAMPVVLNDRVAGVIYLSRTPPDLWKELYGERRQIAVVGLLSLLATLLIGYVFHRAVTWPVGALITRTTAIGRGDRGAIQPLVIHGTAEFAHLSESFLSMAESLNRRSDFLSIFATHLAHEVKSPLTAIKGAAELMRDADRAATKADQASMTPAERRRFLDNIIADVDRLSAVAERLRDLARAEASDRGEAASLASTIADFIVSTPGIEVQRGDSVDCHVPISTTDLGIILAHLADNAAHHGATKLTLHAAMRDGTLHLILHDNGTGISPNNRARIFDSFFTTRREGGGTGMGLTIVRAMLAAHGGTIELLEEPVGAAFLLTLPVVPVGG